MSHSELDMYNPNMYPPFHIHVSYFPIIPHVLFLHFLVWKSNSCMHNIKGGSTLACLHFLFYFSFNIKSFGTSWLSRPFVLTANTQFCLRWAMHRESWTCAYSCEVIFRRACSPVQLNVRALFSFASFTEPEVGGCVTWTWKEECWESGCGFFLWSVESSENNSILSAGVEKHHTQPVQQVSEAVLFGWCCSFKSLTETSGGEFCGTQSRIISVWNDAPSLVLFLNHIFFS